jgi:hypothetical protein
MNPKKHPYVATWFCPDCQVQIIGARFPSDSRCLACRDGRRPADLHGGVPQCGWLLIQPLSASQRTHQCSLAAGHRGEHETHHGRRRLEGFVWFEGEPIFSWREAVQS